MTLPPDPVEVILEEVRTRAAAIIRPRHALFDDLLSEGYVGFFSARNENVPIPESMEAASAAMREFLKKERAYHRPLTPLHDGIQPPPEDGGYFRSGPDSVPESRLAALSALEREVLDLRVGLTGEPPLTVRETAERLGLSRSSVQRTYKKAQRKLLGPVGQDRYR